MQNFIDPNLTPYDTMTGEITVRAACRRSIMKSEEAQHESRLYKGIGKHLGWDGRDMSPPMLGNM